MYYNSVAVQAEIFQGSKNHKKIAFSVFACNTLPEVVFFPSAAATNAQAQIMYKLTLYELDEEPIV